MKQTVNKLFYKAFGFSITSDFPLPELQPLPLQATSPDISIQKGSLEDVWAKVSDPKRYFFVQENLCMFVIPQTAIFLIKDGAEIVVSSFAGAEDDLIRLYLLGTCMGAVLMQRKILPLHGSAIEINGKAYAVVGDSGAGKSTTASALLARGYKLISDDLIPVTFEKNIPTVIPAYPQQKLWQESLNEFGIKSDSLKPLIRREKKFAIPVKSQFTSKSLPLGGIIELVKVDRNHLEMVKINGLGRLSKLFQHTYRNFLLERAGLLEWHFHTTAKMVNRIDFHQIQRPTSYFTANEIADFILKTINEEDPNVKKLVHN